VFAQGTTAPTDRGKDVAIMAGDGMKLPQNGNGLTGQRHDLRLAHLHPLRGNPPYGLITVEDELGPFGGAEFAGTNEYIRSEFEGGCGRGLTDVAVDGS
jgi:hypothetical protein